jgi:DNA-binding NtrC family response regulator
MNATANKTHLSGLRILAVDDEEDILDTIEDLLDEAHVDRAMDYDTASEMLRTNHYDLAILDIMGVNGMDLLEGTANRNIPAVMLTAHAMNPQTLHSSMVKGALSYLPKEELSRLDELLEELLETHRKGESTWKLLFTRLGTFFDNAFGQDWTADYPEIVERYGGPGRWHNQG